METDLDKGYRVSGGVVNLAAIGVANATAVFTISAFAGQIGTKSFIPKKIMVRNNAAGGCWLVIGTGVAGTFVARMPQIQVLNNIDNEWQEVELPRVEFFATMTAYPVTLAVGGSLDIQVEVEERG
jgi:hypothetical protein